MPCSDDPRVFPHGSTATGMDAYHEHEGSRLDRMARLLCEMMAILQAQGLTHLMSAEAQAWYMEHERWDAERRSRANG